MRALIVDDEIAARARLRRLLERHPVVEIAGEAKDGFSALQLIEALEPEVVFLDIQIPGIDGFQVLNELRDPGAAPLVVFTTSFEQHAMRAFKENALAYLLKPIDEEKLRLALDRAERLLGSHEERKEEKERTRRAAFGAISFSSIVGRKQNECFLLKQDDILWFSIEDGIVRAHTLTDSFWLNHRLGSLEESLGSGNFFRARRDVLVNLSHVRVIRPLDRSTFALSMADGQNTEFVVSERQAKELRERLPGL